VTVDGAMVGEGDGPVDGIVDGVFSGLEVMPVVGTIVG